MGFPRKEYWNGMPFPPLGDLPNPGIELGSPALQADALLSEPPRKPIKNISTLKRIATSSVSEQQVQNVLNFHSTLLTVTFMAIYNPALNCPFSIIFFGRT